MKKIFECKDKCREQYVEMVVFGCKKCIKKVAPKLTKKQIEALEAFIKVMIIQPPKANITNEEDI